MSSFSRALISVASLYRGGGWVKCWVASRACRSSAWPAEMQGRQQLVVRLPPGGQTRR